MARKVNEKTKQDKNTKQDKPEKKIPKKRGRKPKGGKIVKTLTEQHSNNNGIQANVILHLKCNDSGESNEVPEYVNINNIKHDTSIHNNVDLGGINDINNNVYECGQNGSNKNTEDVSDNKSLWNKIKKLKMLLHDNDNLDKRSSCFWCTYPFDNPPIYIPKQKKNDVTEVYGCFCSPECAVAYLKKEPLDTSILWERYSLLNNIYSKVYNYNTNIKPAPCPYYTLDKYYGNLSIEEYRKILNKQYLLIVVDKPLTKIMPELYDDNNDTPNIYNNLLNNKNSNNTLRLARNSQHKKVNNIF